MSLTAAVLAKGNFTACCQQETNAMFLSRNTSHYLFSPYSVALLEKLIGSQLVKKFHFMVPLISILYAHKPIICPYPGPHPAVHA
jgi:hypothetical protein